MSLSVSHHTRDLTSGPLLSSLLWFSLPILIGNLFQQLYNIVDTAAVSHLLGADALAALGCTGSLYSVVLCIATGMTSGFSIVVAQTFGAGQPKRLRRTVACIIVLTAVISVFLTAVSLLFSRPFLIALHTPKEILAPSLVYIRTFFAGIVFTMAYNAMAGVLRGIGNSLYPLLFLILSSVLNVGLDLLFLAVFSWGIFGAAIATVLSQLVSAAACLLYIVRCCPLLHVRRRDFRFDADLTANLLFTGLAMGLMQSTVCFGTMIMQSAVNHLGTATIAGYTAARKIHCMLLAVLFAFGNTASTFAGQNLGAGNIRRILSGIRVLVVLGLVWVVLVNLLVFFQCGALARMITGSDSPTVLSAVTRYLRMDVPFYFGISVLIILRYSLQGLGGKLAAVAEGIMEMGGNILSALVLVPRLGYLGVCLCEPITCTACAIFIVIAFTVTARRLWHAADHSLETR
ncbi:MAG: MATE family efflux transporter [Eubacteriales bacterium]|nr:MATE family efflux transporter [Eubacteriales bacterium]